MTNSCCFQEFSGICSLVPSLSESILCTSGLKMYLVESKGGAVACMFLALFFLGTWPALLTMLERRGRLPQHTYLDYSITNFLAALIIAFTFGEIGKSKPDEPNFLAQLAQDNWPSVLFAMGGGVVLSLGNLSSQYAFAFVGLSVTEVLTASITVVIGTSLNYFLDDKINKAEILFPGVGCFLIAVFLGSAVHSSNTADNKAKLNNFSSDYKDGALYVFNSSKEGNLGKEISCGSKFTSKDLEDGNDSADIVKAGTAVFLLELEEKRAIKAVSCFVIAIILNITFLYHPVLNLPKSSFKAYLADSDGRVWALLAGILCGFGNGLQFMGGQAAGYAAADAVQALPLVSTFWGVVLFGEYRKSSRRTYMLLGSMLFMFIVAVAVLMASSGHRNSPHTAKE
uniref:Ureide permease A3 n=1 Tax=Cajanus cajan TaxID=3821 RepID=A0A151TFD2_CAJCA|nr:putative ureide permease A3 [Cajanus cajan]